MESDPTSSVAILPGGHEVRVSLVPIKPRPGGISSGRYAISLEIPDTAGEALRAELCATIESLATSEGEAGAITERTFRLFLHKLDAAIARSAAANSPDGP